MCFLAALLLLGGCKNDSPSSYAHGKLTLEVTNSLAIPNHRVRIEIEGDQLSITRQDSSGESVESEDQLTEEGLAEVWKSVDSIDWRTVQKDRVLGLDGTTYLVKFGDKEYEVWTPESDTEERGLSNLLKLKSLLWTMAGITSGEQGAGDRRPSL